MYKYLLPFFALQTILGLKQTRKTSFLNDRKIRTKISIECRKMSEITIVLLYFAYTKRKPIATWSSASSRVFPRFLQFA